MMGNLNGVFRFLILLFIIQPAFAVNTITVYPQNPISNEQLTCVINENLNCYDLHNSQKLWMSNNVKDPKGMVLSDNKLFVTKDHEALIFNALDGRLISTHHNDGTLFDPVVSSGNLILTDQQGWISVIDIESTQLTWRKKLDNSWIYPPAVISGKLVTGGHRGELWALDITTGKILWHRKLGQEIVYRPISAAGKVFVSSFDGSVRSINAESGEIISATQLDSPAFEIKTNDQQPLVASGYDGKLYALDINSGLLLWSTQVSPSARFKFAFVGSDIASLDYLGHFKLVDSASGRLLQHKDFGGSHQIAPMMTNSKIWIFPNEKPFIRTFYNALSG